MCIDDGNAAERMEQRRELIRSKMFPLLVSNESTKVQDSVWVDARLLRRFLSCNDRLDDELGRSGGKSIIQHRHLLCSHANGGLNPRIARKGKFLPKAAYEAYASRLLEEQDAVMGGLDSKREVSDCTIVPTENLFCETCCEDYRLRLTEKVLTIKALKSLYDSLDPTENSLSLELDVNETEGNECDRYAYIVSRKFITWFRNKVASLMKTAAPGDGILRLVKESPEEEIECVAEGLDALDHEIFNLISSNSEPPGNDEDSQYASVNGAVTCKCPFVSVYILHLLERLT
jgi:hypothetical protein